MTSPYWAKLWIEILDDPKVANMPDWLFRKFIMFVLAAKEYDQAGLLRPVEDLAWRIRSNVKETADALSALEQIGVTRATADGWELINFVKRQDREYVDTPEAIRQRKHREKERTENVTKKRDISALLCSDSVSVSLSDSLIKESEENGKFTEIRQHIEKITGVPAMPQFIKAIEEIIAFGGTAEDITAGYGWFRDNNDKPFKYYGQLVGPTRTAMSKRLGGNGKKPGKHRYDTAEAREKYREWEK